MSISNWLSSVEKGQRNKLDRYLEMSKQLTFVFAPQVQPHLNELQRRGQTTALINTFITGTEKQNL